MVESPECPKCSSANVIFRESRQEFLCGKCDHEFDAPAVDATALRVFLSYGHYEHAVLADLGVFGLHGQNRFSICRWMFLQLARRPVDRYVIAVAVSNSMGDSMHGIYLANRARHQQHIP